MTTDSSKNNMPISPAAKNITAADSSTLYHSSAEDRNANDSKKSECLSVDNETSVKGTKNCSLEKQSSDPETNGQGGIDDFIDIQIPSGMIIENVADSETILKSKPPTTTVPQKPAENLEIDDRAILDCWDLTVASHDVKTTDISNVSADSSSPPPPLRFTFKKGEYYWQAKDLVAPSCTKTENFDVLKNWQPKALALPVWAVDPFEMSYLVDGSECSKNGSEYRE